MYLRLRHSSCPINFKRFSKRRRQRLYAFIALRQSRSITIFISYSPWLVSKFPSSNDICFCTKSPPTRQKEETYPARCTSLKLVLNWYSRSLDCMTLSLAFADCALHQSSSKCLNELKSYRIKLPPYKELTKRGTYSKTVHAVGISLFLR